MQSYRRSNPDHFDNFVNPRFDAFLMPPTSAQQQQQLFMQRSMHPNSPLPPAPSYPSVMNPLSYTHLPYNPHEVQQSWTAVGHPNQSLISGHNQSNQSTISSSDNFVRNNASPLHSFQPFPEQKAGIQPSVQSFKEMSDIQLHVKPSRINSAFPLIPVESQPSTKHSMKLFNRKKRRSKATDFESYVDNCTPPPVPTTADTRKDSKIYSYYHGSYSDEEFSSVTLLPQASEVQQPVKLTTVKSDTTADKDSSSFRNRSSSLS